MPRAGEPSTRLALRGEILGNLKTTWSYIPLRNAETAGEINHRGLGFHIRRSLRQRNTWPALAPCLLLPNEVDMSRQLRSQREYSGRVATATGAQLSSWLFYITLETGCKCIVAKESCRRKEYTQTLSRSEILQRRDPLLHLQI